MLPWSRSRTSASACFRHQDLGALVDWLRAERKMLSFKTSGDLASVRWIVFRAYARVRVKEVSKEAPVLDGAARLLRAQNYDVPYHGESMPSFARCCVEAILVKDRRYLSREQGEERREACENSSAKRGSRERLVMDHVRPLAHGGSNDPSNFQRLCRNCHATRTHERETTRPTCSRASSPSRRASCFRLR